MVLLIAVLAGFAAGVFRARINHLQLQVPKLRALGLLILAYLAQFFIFQIGWSPDLDRTIPMILSGSLFLLLVFAWVNVRQPGFWLLGMGALFNTLVIVLNDGFMPVSPETVQRLAPEVPKDALILGQRLGTSKDILLHREQTHFWWFSDLLVLPDWVPWQSAISVGDVVITVGAFWFFWSLGSSAGSGSPGV